MDHHLLMLLQRPQQQQQHVLLQHPVLLQYTLLQHPLSSKDNASTSSDILAAALQAVTFWRRLPRYNSSRPHPWFGIDTHVKVNVAATFGQKMSPVWAYSATLHRRFRPRDEPGQERHAPCVAETARSAVCIPLSLIHI